MTPFCASLPRSFVLVGQSPSVPVLDVARDLTRSLRGVRVARPEAASHDAAVVSFAVLAAVVDARRELLARAALRERLADLGLVVGGSGAHG